VGSIPAATAEEAMTEAVGELGPFLRALPDGETGDRDRWIAGTIEGFRRNPDLVVRREGDWSDYKRQLNYSVRRGHRLTGEDLDVRLYRPFRDSRGIFQRLRADSGRTDLAFQVGVPGDFDLAMFTLGPLRALRHRGAFTAATVREVARIHAEAGVDVVFQLEMPAELVLVTKAPRVLRGVLASLMARGVARLIDRSPQDARFGVHLCLGDLGHKALGRMRDADPVVRLANAIASAWPAGHPLEYLHAPLAAGENPPPLDPAFYRPLARLRLPERTRFVAGFLHERRSIDQVRRILEMVESQYGRSVDVAAACGLARRGHDNALATMRQAAALCAGVG